MLKSKFKIWLGCSQTSRVSWGDLQLVEVKSCGPGELYVTVEGDGKDLEEWVSARRDIFGVASESRVPRSRIGPPKKVWLADWHHCGMKLLFGSLRVITSNPLVLSLALT
jgi:hypothetical protein